MMCQDTSRSDPEMQERLGSASELFRVVHQLSCACAAHARHVDASVSRDLFYRVEGQGQSLVEAAKALGLGPKDCAYLLAGFRQDVAAELVAMLVTAKIPRTAMEAEGPGFGVQNDSQ